MADPSQKHECARALVEKLMHLSVVENRIEPCSVWQYIVRVVNNSSKWRIDYSSSVWACNAFVHCSILLQSVMGTSAVGIYSCNSFGTVTLSEPECLFDCVLLFGIFHMHVCLSVALLGHVCALHQPHQLAALSLFYGREHEMRAKSKRITWNIIFCWMISDETIDCSMS